MFLTVGSNAVVLYGVLLFFFICKQLYAAVTYQ